MKILGMKGFKYDFENTLLHHLKLEFGNENATRGSLEFRSLFSSFVATSFVNLGFSMV
jgi:hypothetical protein